MRIKQEQIQLLKKEITSILPDAEIYFFGSRVDDNKKGGDIDILIIASRKLNWKEKSIIRWRFFEKFGEQKLDIISYSFEDNITFKKIAQIEGIRV